MTTLEFLSHLRGQDIRIWAEGDRLRYSAPAGGLTPELQAELVKRKTDILSLLRRTWAKSPRIHPVPRDGTLPLSFGQERLWFLDQLEPGNPAYNTGRALRLSGPLDVDVLEQSLGEIVQRHESLRTNFAMVDGQPVQVIAPARKVPMIVLDVPESSDAESGTMVEEITREELRRPFNLERDPLLRTKLIRLDEEDHILILTIHHIVSDSWSIRVLFRELSALYTAFCNGEESPLPELPIQYADFAVWQREWLQGETLETHLAYWKQQIGGGLPALELPTDHPRPGVQTHRGAKEELLLAKPLTQALKALSAREDVTLYMLLLAAFEVLLFRYTAQEDILVGSPISGRDLVEVEGLIGYFLNTLVLRSSLAQHLTFRQLLHQVRETVLGAFEHQVIPFEALLQELQPERSLSRSPVFQAMFVLHDPSPLLLQLPGLHVEWLEIGRGAAMFDLSLIARDTEEGLDLTLPYNRDLFDAATISRMLNHLETMLASIAATPEQRISRLQRLPEAERQKLLVDWNRTQVDHPRHMCVQDLFEAQARRTPDAVAVVHKDRQLTYAELDRRANKLSRCLQALGVGPDVLVGVCMERSLEMVVGLLGILKAGGAYVPLDPALPQQRLALMLEAVSVPVLLTQRRLLPLLPRSTAQILCLDSDWGRVSAESQEAPDRAVCASNLAYVIFTSGSTGRPRGVMIQHGSLANYTAAAGDLFALTSSDRVLQFASISFDAAAEEIFPCLARGATLVLRTNEMLGSIPQFLEACHDWAITVLDLPTAYWHEIVGWLGTEPMTFPPSMRLVIIGGEKAQREKLAEWQQYVAQHPKLLNSYGPTEATIVATLADLPGNTSTHAPCREVPIGRPVDNVQTYILDRHLQLAPVGVFGELYIGGAGLARGYLDMPALTAERFVPDPFRGVPGARLYRTGDLARYRPEGSIEFFGRIDHQVKVRGFRVELGEIETVLSEHPAVGEAMVLVHENAESGRRLVAYVTPATQLDPPGVELRSFLKTRLPEYMVPSAFVLLKTLPRTATGKIDREALPGPDWSRPELEQAFVAPRSPVEEALADIWIEVLGIDQVGVYDSFFELGGHSLLATQVISRVQSALQAEIPLLTIFEAPTIAELSQAIIAREKQTGQTKRTARMLMRIRSMPAEEMRRLLQQKRMERNSA